MVYISSSQVDNGDPLLNEIELQDNNMSLTLKDDQLKIKIDGEWNGSMQDLIGSLYELVKMQEVQCDQLTSKGS